MASPEPATSPHSALLIAATLLAAACAACISPIDEQPFCADDEPSADPLDREVTWHGDVRPIVEGRCARCHAPGEVGPFPLETYEQVFAYRGAVAEAVTARSMPPFLPAGCCNEFQDDISLSAEQIEIVNAWVNQGAPEGDESNYDGPLDPVGGLSRVDVEISMPRGYTPQPAPGRVDDFRCFVLDWPLDEETFVTGLNPLPGARQIVHHLIVATVDASTADSLRDLEGEDGRPGFECEGGLGSFGITGIIGGSLLGGDFPEGLGHRVDADSRILLNIHYSLVDDAPAEDLTSLQFRVDPVATEFQTLLLMNPAWTVGDAMHIDAGDANAVYRYQYDPFILTRGRDIELVGYTPHMHALGSRMKAMVVRRNGDTDCLIEMPDYDFGWEQPFWFAEGIPFGRGDQLYIQCHTDNSADNQAIVGGVREEPRDIAWGTDNQEMCVGFVSYVVR